MTEQIFMAIFLGMILAGFIAGVLCGWDWCRDWTTNNLRKQESLEVAGLRRSLTLTQAAWETERAMWQTAQQPAQGRW